MLEKYSWLVIVRCINGKRYAYAERWSHNTSLTGFEVVNLTDYSKQELYAWLGY